jgi:uncharacterized protein DUF87/helicase HerA-like protein
VTLLRLSADFTLPPEAVTETFAILAKRGVGKTYTASVLAEELIKVHLHTVICNPIGVWWGLRAAADSKGPGLPITILGGDHGDAPLELTAGELVADLIVDERISAVLDLSRFRKGEQQRFMQDFAERLYHKNRQALHLILDEADAFAPQRPLPGAQRLLGAIEDLVRRGRARGIGVTLVTQRAAVINKDVLTQAEVLVALRTIAPQDRAAIDEWVKVHGSPEQRDQLMASLPSLPIGTAWFWSPGWLDVFQRVKVRRRETYDSSATPKAGQKREAPRQLAEVDLAKLRERMASAIERKKQEDPAELRKRIADLERQLRARPTEAKVETRIERVEVPVIGDEALQALRDSTRLAQEAASALSTAAEQIARALGGAQRMVGHRSAPAETITPARVGATPARRQRESRGDLITARLPKGAGGVSGPQQRILDALASFEALGIRDAAKSNVAAFSDASPRSSAFTNNLGSLRTAGYLDYPAPGRVALTEAGRAASSPTTPITSVSQLHAAWFSKLSGPQARILGVLIDRYPRAIDKEELAERAGASPSSSAYTNNLGSLRSLGLISYPGRGLAAATSVLFPEGVPA